MPDGKVCGSQALIIFKRGLVLGLARASICPRHLCPWTECGQPAKLAGALETLDSDQFQATQASSGSTNLLLLTNVNNTDQGPVSSLPWRLPAGDSFVSQALFACVSSPTLCVDFFLSGT